MALLAAKSENDDRRIIDLVCDEQGRLITVERSNLRVAGRQFDSGLIAVQGIVAAAAYAAGDTFGIQFTVSGAPRRGRVDAVVFYDLDDEGIAKTFAFFNGAITQTADNAALSVSTTDNVKSLGHLQMEAADFADLGASRVGTLRPSPAFTYALPSDAAALTVQLQTQGADNIASAALPLVRFLITPLEAA